MFIEPSKCQHSNSIPDGDIGGPDDPVHWAQDPGVAVDAGRRLLMVGNRFLESEPL